MSKHKDFILTPIAVILNEVVSANVGIGDGIETYPLIEYIMQSLFLKMTVFQEQKMKCICWELATEDYEYRYDRYTKKTLGECSSYEEKKNIYKDIIGIIKKLDPSFNVSNVLDRQAILIGTKTDMGGLFLNSNLYTWVEREFMEFQIISSATNSNHFATDLNLFENVLQDQYKLLYKHRNRCAHNTLSYQENLPTLTDLFREDHKYDNYLVRFFLLILIDKIFIELYKIYLNALEEK